MFCRISWLSSGHAETEDVFARIQRRAAYAALSLAVELPAEGMASAAVAAGWSGRRARGRFVARHGLWLLRRRIRTPPAHAPGIQHLVALANDLDATIALDLLSLGANQRADAIGLGAHRIERIEAEIGRAHV